MEKDLLSKRSLNSLVNFSEISSNINNLTAIHKRYNNDELQDFQEESDTCKTQSVSSYFPLPSDQKQSQLDSETPATDHRRFRNLKKEESDGFLARVEKIQAMSNQAYHKQKS